VGGEPETLSDIAPAIVSLEKEASSAAVGRCAAVPHVADEQSYVAGRRLEQNCGPVFVGEIGVERMLSRREHPRTVAAGEHGRGPVSDGAVAEHDVCADREHGVGNAVVPWHVGWTRHVWTGIAVPWASREIGAVAPQRVGDDVAVVAKKRFDHLKDAGVANGAMGALAVVQHLIPVLVVAAPRMVSIAASERVVGIGYERCDLADREHVSQHGVPVALELHRCLGNLRTVGREHRQVLADATDHER